MKSNTYVFGLLVLVGAVTGAVSTSVLLRAVCMIIVVGSAVLLGIALGSKPFQKQ